MWEKRREITVGEFFSGPGGMAAGARQACADHGVTFKHEWAFDLDPWACKTYGRNIVGDENALVPTDVTTIDISKLSKVDLFLFGFPCNDFSVAGESKGFDGLFGKLYKVGIDYLNTHRPTAFIAENVSGLMHSRKGGVSPLELIVADMREAGYEVYPHLYKLEQYGLPQARHRIMIVGIHKLQRRNSPTFRVPAPTHARPSDQISCRAAIDGGVLHGNKPIAPDAPNHKPGLQSNNVVERLKRINPGQNVWEAMALGQIPEEFCIKASKTSLSQIYRKLDPDLPAYTITGSGGGGTHVYHWEEPRALTNRERARLQTFDDDYVFCGGNAHVRKQIGMAVPPAGARIVVGALLAALRGKGLKDGIEPNLMSHDQVELAFAEEMRKPLPVADTVLLEPAGRSVEHTLA